MERRSQEPEAAQSLRVQILEIDLRVANVENEEYRRLLLSLANGGIAAPATSIRPASPSQSSRLQANVHGLTSTQTSSRATSQHASPARRERSIRAFRRDLVVEIPSIPRPASRPVYAQIFSNVAIISHTTKFISTSRRLPVDQPESRAPNGRNDGPEDASNHLSTISYSTGSSSHENEAADTLNAPQPELIQAMLSGITPYPLSWGEKVRVDQTPKVSWRTLNKIFGVTNTEWVKCRHMDYPRMFLAKIVAQPFMPTSTGSHGLAILEPAWADADEGENHMFPVFVSTSGKQVMEYMGDYTKVILPQKNIDWFLLPTTVGSS